MLPFLKDQASIAELGKVEGQRAVRNAKRISDRARRHAFVSSLNEQAEQGEAMFLRERAERFDGVGRPHPSGSSPN
jgi:hypothetical protein